MFCLNVICLRWPVIKFAFGLCRMELRCVIAVIRHGDRTPKQKMKMEVRHQRYSMFSPAEGCDGIMNIDNLMNLWWRYFKSLYNALKCKWFLIILMREVSSFSFDLSLVICVKVKSSIKPSSFSLSFRFFDLFEKCEGYKSGKLKLKKPKQLQVG